MKIYVQKAMFWFMNAFSLLFLFCGLYGGFVFDKSWFYALFVSVGLFVLSTMMLINKIYYDDKQIRFALIYKKETVKYSDIKEIFVQYGLHVGAYVIFNLEKTIDEECGSYSEYYKKCKASNINNVGIVCFPKKDLEKLLSYCKCEIKIKYNFAV